MSPNTLMIVNLLSPDGRYDGTFLSNYATIYIKDELGRLPGVAGITYLGQRDYSLRAWLNPDKLAVLEPGALWTSVAAISQQNSAVAAGQIGQQPAPCGTAIPADDHHPGAASSSRSSSPRSSSRPAGQGVYAGAGIRIGVAVGVRDQGADCGSKRNSPRKPSGFPASRRLATQVGHRDQSGSVTWARVEQGSR